MGTNAYCKQLREQKPQTIARRCRPTLPSAIPWWLMRKNTGSSNGVTEPKKEAQTKQPCWSPIIQPGPDPRRLSKNPAQAQEARNLIQSNPGQPCWRPAMGSTWASSLAFILAKPSKASKQASKQSSTKRTKRIRHLKFVPSQDDRTWPTYGPTLPCRSLPAAQPGPIRVSIWLKLAQYHHRAAKHLLYMGGKTPNKPPTFT